MADELDRARVEGLAKLLAEAVRDNYLRGPPSRDRILEALNALASVAGFVIRDWGDGGEALGFFELAFKGELDRAADAHPG